jgi:hypothetical protein
VKDQHILEELGRIADSLEIIAGTRIAEAELENLRTLARPILINRNQDGSFVDSTRYQLSQAADVIDRLLERDPKGDPL